MVVYLDNAVAVYLIRYIPAGIGLREAVGHFYRRSIFVAHYVEAFGFRLLIAGLFPCFQTYGKFGSVVIVGRGAPEEGAGTLSIMDKFLFLVMFNSGSVMERKNPLAAIKAFKESFCKDEETKKKYKDVGLVIKISEAELSTDDEKIINSVVDKDDNIYYMCGHLNKTEVNSLIADVDVYVSLHRSEGFGLVMAEAMYVGTPVIATNWSGNTEFMNSDTACMVGYDMKELDKDYEPFKKGNLWADAHVDEAAQFMKKLYEDKEFYNKIAVNGQNYAKEHLAYKRSADIVSDRIRKIHGVFDKEVH